MDWAQKTVFVTGATGLLGSHLTRKLVDAGAHVIILVRDEPAGSLLIQSEEWNVVTKVHGELQSFDLLLRTLTEYEVEYVFHLAAQTQVTHANEQPLETFESNIRGTYNLLEACRQYGKVKGVLVASSDKAYGVQEELPYKEDAPLQGCHPYDVSKSCTDLLAQSYFTTYKLPVCVTRCGNLFGPGDLNFIRIIPEAILAWHEKKKLQLRSDGTFVRDYLFVEDAADGNITMLEHIDKTQGEAFNLSTGNKLTVLDVVDAVSEALGDAVQVEILNNATGEIPHQYLSSEKAKSVLGWEPVHDFLAGMKKTVPAYKNYLEKGRW